MSTRIHAAEFTNQATGRPTLPPSDRSLLSNLVYPAISSLISRSVATSKQGEVLGAINGVRALTEGFGPLLFSCLFWYTEDTFLPGCPYLIAAVVCLAALVLSYDLPDTVDDDDSGLLLGTYGKDLPEGGPGAEEMVGLLASDGDEEGEVEEREEEGVEGRRERIKAQREL